MVIDYSNYNGYIYPAIVFDSKGTLIYMNESAKKVFGDFCCGSSKCHYIYRGFESECKNHIQCVCGQETTCKNMRANFIRQVETLNGKAFFIVERSRIKGSDHFIEQLYDITKTAENYIENGWMTRMELENMLLDVDSGLRMS